MNDKNLYQKRTYRNLTHKSKFYKMQISVKETDLLILSSHKLDRNFVKQRILFYRDKIQEYINYQDKNFSISLKPVNVELTSHKIIKDMASESFKSNVGPMACVAGAIAQYLGKDLLKKSREVIIENGGDIFLKTDCRISIGLFAGKGNYFNNLYIEIPPKKNGLGVCTSSATIGHSLSFGQSDAAVVIAKNAILADGVATAVGNLVNDENDFLKAINFAKSINGVLGVLVILGKKMASWGKIKLSNKKENKY